ncbi:Leucine-rich receptor-like protein kinase family protein [Rhynchospora pubera]|uniref:non-specific serine/threonine protein kinase n=1 Tax=Rhynchospora pubera TaxID=906938 RepID=A0AAV8BZA0_9POAL|nr:Leucine-rich receptor-like protein kinase family protein [Rhynchospora pubera]
MHPKMSAEAFTILTFILTLFILISPVELASPKVSDIPTLYSLRSSLSQSKDFLPSWFDSETPPCSWQGIKCIHLSVISVNLFNIPLNGPFPQVVTEFGALRQLNLSGCGLTGPLPELPGSRLGELEVLDLSQNKLTGRTPDWITNLTSLNQLVLNSNSFSGKLEPSIGFLKNLVILRISDCSFFGDLPPELGQLKELEILDLGANNFTGLIPSSFASLSKLLHLDISHNRLSGTIFPGIGSLVNLLTLDLSSNSLTGPIPSSIGKLVSLESLWLGFNGFMGAIPVEVGNLEGLRVLSLTTSKLTGSIPMELNNLKALTDLDISENEFEGELPSNIGELKNLMFLIAANAGLTGEIPESLGQCTNLEIIDLSFNSFSGPLPDSLAMLGSISSFIVEGNQLSGQIPEWIKNWKMVTSLRFSKNNFLGELPPLPLQYLATFSADSNHLSGKIPSRICEAKSLNLLSVSENELTGTIQETFKECRNLTDLILSGNKLSGEIPGYLSELPLDTLEMLQNNFTGPLPDKLFESKTLLELSLSNNGLTGQIPASIGRLSGLQRLQLDNNLFTGSIPHLIGNLKNLTILSLHGNRLSGEIPSELFDCMNLVALDLGSNELNGSIPTSISLLTQLNNLVLSNNRLTGEIPDSICNGYSAVVNYPDSEFYQHYGVLDLSYNSLIGYIPTGMRKCMVLKELRLQGNMLTGALPSELFELTNLTYIDLSFNSLTGELRLFPFKKLQGLILSHNEFKGPIPHEIGSVLPSLFKLNLSCNRFTGYLPESVFNIESLTDLDISQNFLSGTLPFSGLTGTSSLLIFNGSINNFSGMVESSISNFTSLSVLDLHGNQLTGTLPMAISKLEYLRYIDLSENNFQDLIPCSICSLASLSFANFSGNQFRGFNPENCASTADFGSNNPCLASQVAPLVAQPPPHALKKSSVWRTAVVIIACFTTILMALLAWKCLNHKSLAIESVGTKSKSGSSAEPVSSDELLGRRAREPLSINLATFEHSLLRITAGDILQATGNFSKAHIIGDGGNGTVYKALLSTGVVAVKRLHGGTHFGGGDREFLAEMETIGKVKHQNLVPLLGYCVYQDERFLIYEYMANGSLDAWLRKGADAAEERLGWARMLEIILGSAKGLAFLHHGFVPHIIHRDMKSSNILLDENFKPRVSDFGFARIISACETHVSTDIAGTIGYFPPEYGFSMKCTPKGDVYSFGVVMLEMLTGRAPTGQDEAEGGGNLVGWVRWMVRKNREDEVFDLYLPSTGPERQQMKKVLELARDCTSDNPCRRPDMREVVRRLEGFKMLHAGGDVVIISV